MLKFKYSEEAQQKIQEALQEKAHLNNLLALTNQPTITFSPQEIEEFKLSFSTALLKDIEEQNQQPSQYAFSYQKKILQSPELQKYLKIEIENNLGYKEFVQTASHLRQREYLDHWKNLIYQIKDLTRDSKEGIEPKEYNYRQEQLSLNYKALCEENESFESFSLIDPNTKGFLSLVFQKQNIEVLRILLSLGYNPLSSSVRSSCDMLATYGLKQEIIPLKDIEKFHELGLDWDWFLVFGKSDTTEELFMIEGLKGRSVLKAHPLAVILNQPLNQFRTPAEKDSYLDFFARHSSILNDPDIVELLSSYCPDTEGEELSKSLSYFFATQEKQKLLEGTVEVIDIPKITFKI